MSLVDRVRTSVVGALGRALKEHESALADVEVSIERPKKAEHGHFATNVALVLTKKVGMPPRAIAEKLVAELQNDDVVKDADLAGPGFVNVRLRASAIHAELSAILEAGTAFG